MKDAAGAQRTSIVLMHSLLVTTPQYHTLTVTDEDKLCITSPNLDIVPSGD